MPRHLSPVLASHFEGLSAIYGSFKPEQTVCYVNKSAAHICIYLKRSFASQWRQQCSQPLCFAGSFILRPGVAVIAVHLTCLIVAYAVFFVKQFPYPVRLVWMRWRRMCSKGVNTYQPTVTLPWLRIWSQRMLFDLEHIRSCLIIFASQFQTFLIQT